jgi:peptidoglycan/xylan/chitin deacetylase (PgdA/CDA1 family)
MTHSPRISVSRRSFLKTASATAIAAGLSRRAVANASTPAQIAITLDLEMSRHFPRWEDTHWDYEKGNLDEPTKRYAVEAARRVKSHGGRIHFFALGRTMEQPSVDWLKGIAHEGHPIGNHTYDHINLLANKPEDIQFRFQRAPWLIAGRSVSEIIAENIRLGEVAISERVGVQVQGFRTPGGFYNGLSQRPDLQDMLLSHGYTWISSRYPQHKNTQPEEPVTAEVFADIVRAQQDAQPLVYPSGLIEIPMSPVSDVGALRSGRWKLGDFLAAIRQAVTWAIDHGKAFDFLAHPSCLVVADPKFEAIELICELVEKSHGRAELVTLNEIAESVRPQADGR